MSKEADAKEKDVIKSLSESSKVNEKMIRNE